MAKGYEDIQKSMVEVSKNTFFTFSSMFIILSTYHFEDAIICSRYVVKYPGETFKVTSVTNLGKKLVTYECH